MKKSSRVRDSQEEANVTQLQYVYQEVTLPDVKTLEDFGLCFVKLLNTVCSQLVLLHSEIAAGGKSSGSGKSRGGLVRIVFWPIVLDEQLVLSTQLPWGEGALLSFPPGGGAECEEPSEGKELLWGCTEPAAWPTGAQSQKGKVAAAEQGGSAQVCPL